METNILCTIVFLPLITGFILLFLPDTLRAVSKSLALVISIAAFIFAIRIFTSGGADFSWTILHLEPNFGNLDLTLMLTSRPLGNFMLLFAAGFGVLIVLYSFKTIDKTVKRVNEFFGSILLAIGGSAGILLSDNLLFLLIFWEIVTASLYLLVATGGKKSNFAATKTFAMIGASDAAFLFGVMLVWTLSGTFVISDISLPINSALSVLAFILFMIAAITKAGAMPLHTWLPASGEYAPASVMALLPAAVDKLLGIYLLVLTIKSIFLFNSPALSLVLAIIGTATVIIAVMVAMVQHNLKKLLSYHAISQVGYMILGISTGTPVGMAGGVFHMLNHAIYKCCLFLCGGAVEQQTGTAELDELGGLGRKMSITFSTCLIAALSISGIPPLNGFVSKWMVYQGVIEMGNGKPGLVAGLWPVWLVGAMFGSALTLASFVKIIHSIFLSRLPDKFRDVKEVSIFQTAPMIILAVLCVFFGIFYHIPLKLFIYPALGIETIKGLSTWSSGLATIMIIAGVALGIIIWLVGRFSKQIRIVPTWTCGEIQTNEQMTIPGTHFYKTVSQMGGLKELYAGQEKGYFDTYNQSGRIGLLFTGFLKWLHSGVLPMYLTWVTLGLLAVLFALCQIW